MRKVRQIHNYVGLFFAPMILLFALSGALQTFRLQETHDPTAPPPARWIVWMASVHKDQQPPRDQPKRPPPPSGAHTEQHRAPPPATRRLLSPLPLKIFVTALSIGLILSTLLGITIALTNPLTRRVSIFLLAAGTIMPLLLLL
jgi:hypothetical protein